MAVDRFGGTILDAPVVSTNTRTDRFGGIVLDDSANTAPATQYDGVDVVPPEQRVIGTGRQNESYEELRAKEYAQRQQEISQGGVLGQTYEAIKGGVQAGLARLPVSFGKAVSFAGEAALRSGAVAIPGVDEVAAANALQNQQRLLSEADQEIAAQYPRTLEEQSSPYGVASLGRALGEGIPQVALAAVNPPAALASIGVSETGDAYSDFLAMAEQSYPNATPGERQAIAGPLAAGYGAVSTAIEKLLDPLQTGYGKQVSKQIAGRMFRQFAGTLIKGTAQNAGEEALQQATREIAELGVNPTPGFLSSLKETLEAAYYSLPTGVFGSSINATRQAVTPEPQAIQHSVPASAMVPQLKEPAGPPVINTPPAVTQEVVAPAPPPAAPAPQAPAAVPQVAAPQEEASEVSDRQSLPPLLAGKSFKHRVNEGEKSRGITLEFESPVDKALYAIAQPRQGKVQAEAKQFLISQGIDEAAFEADAAEVMDRVNKAATGYTESILQIPDAFSAEEATTTYAKPAQTATAPVATPAAVPRPAVQPAKAVSPAPQQVQSVQPKPAATPATDDDAQAAIRTVSTAATLKGTKFSLTPPNKVAADLSKAVHKRSGRKIVFVKDSPGSFVHPAHPNVLFVGSDAESISEATFHELHHKVQEQFPELASELESAFTPQQHADAAKRYADRARRAGLEAVAREVEQNPEARRRETGALLVGEAMKNPELVKSWGVEVRGKVRQFIDKILTALGVKKKLTKQEQEIKAKLEKVISALESATAPVEEQSYREVEAEARQAGMTPVEIAQVGRDAAKLKSAVEARRSTQKTELDKQLDAALAESDARMAKEGRRQKRIVSQSQMELSFLPDPTPRVREEAAEYNRQAGLSTDFDTAYPEVNVERAKKIAAWYDSAVDAPSDPQVKAAYDALKAETKAQYEFLVKKGVKFEPFLGKGEPYKNSREMLADVRDNRHLWFFLTEQGFGQEGQAQTHPLLEKTGVMLAGKELTYNDLFRAVHDYFGHAKEGVGFGPRGEEGAWRSHSQMFTLQARRAMSAETRGQNSWVNFGPKAEHNRANPKDTIFAEQKALVMPDEWVSVEREDGLQFLPAKPKAREKALENLSTIDLREEPLNAERTMFGVEPQRPATVKTDEVARLLNERTKKLAGQAKAREAEKLERAVAAGIPEAEYQLGQPDSGKDWYKSDIAKMEKTMQALHPSLKKSENMTVFKAILAITSQGNNPNINLKFAEAIYRHWNETGEILKKQPNGKNWPGTLGENYRLPLGRLEKLIEKHGIKGTAKWLLTKHAVSEINAFSESIGMNANVAGPKDEQVYGFEIFGPKIGVFALNQHGIQEKITKDMWFSRTWNRWMGTLIEGGEVVDAPRNDDERQVMDKAVSILASKLGMDPSEVQAVLWYYEQQLWKAHGAKAESGSYSKAAKRVQDGDRYDLARAFAGREGESTEEGGEDSSTLGLSEDDGGSGDISFLPGRKFFRRGGDLPGEVVQRNDTRQGRIAAHVKKAKFNARKLAEAIREDYGVQANKLPQPHVLSINRALKGEAVILPPATEAAVNTMRAHLDEISGDIAISNAVNPRLAAILGSNLGKYVNRSYRVFDDPDWAKKIPQHVMDNAIRFIQGSLAVTKAGPRPVTWDEAKLYVDELLADWKQGGVDSLFGGAKLGSKNLTILKQRKDIAPELRALMGEYNNPFTNYVKSIGKMASLLANHQFLEGVKADGMGKWLFTDKTAKEGFTTRIAAEGSNAMSPLNGLRTSPEIAQAFADFYKSKEMPGWLRIWGVANFAAKSAKTVYSLMTQMRNLIGQPYFNLLNGHFRVSKYGKAFATMAADFRNKGTAAQELYIQRLYELGVLGQGVKANELLADLRDMGFADTDVYTESGFLPAMKRAGKAGLKAMPAMYQVSDHLGKVFGFENELARVKEAFPALALPQQEEMAAERVLNTYPTYSRVPAGVQALRRQPFVGPFISFWYESFRTFGNSVLYAAEDMASGNKARRRHAAERLLGITAVAGGGVALQALTKALLGLSDEDEEDFRKFQPSWSKGNIFMFLGKDDDGNLRTLDLSALNPYSALVDAGYALFSGEGDAMSRMAEAVAEFFRPLTSEAIFTAAMLDVARNRTSSGRRIYNPEDSQVNQWKDTLGHLLSAIEPGTVDRFRNRILPGLRGEETSFGDKIRPSDEIAAETFGLKFRSFNFSSGLSFQARAFNQAQSDINSLFLRELTRPGTLNAEKVVESYEEMENRRYAQWSDLHDKAEAAIRSGLSRVEVFQALVRGGVGTEQARAIVRGIYVPYNLKGESVKAAFKQHGTLPLEELGRVRRQFAGKKLGE